MLSSLSKGYGSWTAGQIDPYYGEKYVADNILPDIDLGSHRHGITVNTRSGRSTAMSWAGTRPVSRQHTEGSISLPKTYSTKKGALQLFTGPDYEEEDVAKPDERLPLRAMYSQLRRQFTKQELVDLSLKLGTLERLTKSVLQFGDEDYDRERTSVSDEKNKAFLKFLHSIDRCDTDLDEHVQPGGDLSGYLRDLKSSASQRYYSDGSTYLPKSRESQELQAILRGLDSNWPLSFKQDSFSDVQSTGQFTRPVSRGPSPGPPSTPRSTYQVLSSRKVAASIKSGSYLGRPSSTVSDFDGDESLADFDFLPVTDVNKRLSSPEFLNPDDLITGRSRRGLGYRSLTGSSIGEETEDDITDSYFEFGKRKHASKKPDLSNQGRHAHKGEGQHIDVKIKGKGDGFEGESQIMDSIVEEVGETGELETENLGIIVDDEIESVDWEAKVAEVERQRGKLLSGRNSIEPNLIKNSDANEINASENDLQQITTESGLVRESSAHSRRSSISSRSSSRSSKHSARETRAISIVSVQEYNASRSSSSSGNRTFTPLSRQSPKRTASSDKQSSSYLKSDSRRASLTGSELRNKDDNVVNEIDEIQAINAINEDQEIIEELNQRNNDFVTQGQIHIDISYCNDQTFSREIENNFDEKVSDVPDNAGFEEIVDTQVGLDDQKSSLSESEDENVWAGNETVEEEQQSETVEEKDDEELQKPKSPDEVSQLVSSEHEETDQGDTEIFAEVNVEKEKEPEQDKEDHEAVDQIEKNQDEVEISKQEIVVGKVEEDSLDESGSNKDKSNNGEEVNYEKGLAALGPLLSDVLSEKGDKSGDATSIISELDALGLRVPVKHKKKAVKEKEKMVIPGHLEEVLSRQPTKSYEALEADLEKMTELVDETLSGPTLAAIGEGLTEEELELAKQILQKKMQDARDKLDQPDEKKAAPKKKVTVKTPKKGKGKRSVTPVDTRTDVEREQDEIKEKQRLEKQKRDQEAKELQRKIAERRLLLKAQTDAQSARSKELEAEMARFQQEADEIQQAEDQARDAMAELRKKQREERDTRRKADLERKKAEAIARREREKRQMEETKRKELEMLEKIQDAEMRRRLREEEERKMYEEERLAQEKLEPDSKDMLEELREAQRQAEEEEERMKELERQAEEEAMQRLIEEREAAERHRRRLQEEKEAMEEAERLKLEYLQQEELRLFEEKQRMEAEENARREQERLRLFELRKLEEEARAKMQEELEKRRADALARRDFNIENRQNKDKLGHGQGITRAWTFSYFIKWPRESYEKSMGGINPKLKRFNPRPKKQPKPASAGTEKPPDDPPPT